MARTRLRGIALGGVELAIEQDPALPWKWPGRDHEENAKAPADGACHIGVRRGDARALVDPDAPAIWMGRFRVVLGIKGPGLGFGVFRGQRCERAASFDAAMNTGEVVVDPSVEPGIFPLLHPLDELIATRRLITRGGLALSGAALIRDRRALLFLGSEAAPRVRSHWLVPQATGVGGARLVGTPWSAGPEIPLGGSLRVDALHCVHRSPAVFGRELRGERAVAELLGHRVASLQPLDDESLETLRESAAKLIEGLSVRSLGLPAEGKVVPFTWVRRPAPVRFGPFPSAP